MIGGKFMYDYENKKDFFYWLGNISKYVIKPIILICLVYLVIYGLNYLDKWYKSLPVYEVELVRICEIDKCTTYSKEEIKEVSSGKWNTSVVFEDGTKIVVDNDNIYIEYKRIN